MRNNFTYRNDNLPGYIYLMEAKGFHGIIPGYYLKRCKIGLSRNPEMRLDTFHSNQPPCDIEIVKTIFVQDMDAVESELHTIFKSSNVKLKKSREWFDLNPVDYARVLWVMNRRESVIKIRQHRPLPARLLMIYGLAVLVSILIFGSGQNQPTVNNQPTVQKAK